MLAGTLNSLPEKLYSTDWMDIMKTLLSIFGIAALLIFSTADAKAQALTAVFSAQVEEDEIDAFGEGIDLAFFNVQGDDDFFTVYSLVDFDPSSIDTMGGTVSSITSLSLDIAQSNAFFSASGDIEFFLASDTRVVDLTDTARYISDFNSVSPTGVPNTGADVVGDAFGTLYSLGTGTYTETATGDIDTFTFSLGPGGEAFAVSQINSGGLLRVIGTPADVGVQATYSGAGSILLPDPIFPVLNITVGFGGAPTPIKGDVDMSGTVDFSDIAPFIAVLQGGGFQAEADCDCSLEVDFADIPAFIAILQMQ